MKQKIYRNEDIDKILLDDGGGGIIAITWPDQNNRNLQMANDWGGQEEFKNDFNFFKIETNLFFESVYDIGFDIYDTLRSLSIGTFSYKLIENYYLIEFELDFNAKGTIRFKCSGFYFEIIDDFHEIETNKVIKYEDIEKITVDGSRIISMSWRNVSNDWSEIGKDLEIRIDWQKNFKAKTNMFFRDVYDFEFNLDSPSGILIIDKFRFVRNKMDGYSQYSINLDVKNKGSIKFICYGIYFETILE
jgi:hypothetical protein